MKQEKQIASAKKAILVLILITPVLIFLLGTILPSKPYSSMLSDCFWSNKIEKDDLYDIVATGDSRIYRGINPEIITKKLHRSAFNYGFSSAGLDSNLIGDAVKLLNLKGNKILLIGISPASFTRVSLRNEHLLSLKKVNPKDRWMRKKIYPYLTFFETYSLSDLKKSILHENYFQTFNENGFVYSTKTPQDTFQALKPYIQFMSENSQDKQAVNSFLKLIEHLHSAGITCYGFRVPISAPIKELEDKYFDFSGFRNDFTNAGGKWINLSETGWNSYDGSHLEGPSANKLTEIISDSLFAIKSIEQ